MVTWTACETSGPPPDSALAEHMRRNTCGKRVPASSTAIIERIAVGAVNMSSPRAGSGSRAAGAGRSRPGAGTRIPARRAAKGRAARDPCSPGRSAHAVEALAVLVPRAVAELLVAEDVAACVDDSLAQLVVREV